MSAPAAAIRVARTRSGKEHESDKGALFGSVFRSTETWDERPIREELFGIERLEQHARSLAAAQAVETGTSRQSLLAGRLADNGVVLLAAYRDIARAVEDRVPITPAAEWLIDNYHVVEKQIREIRADLPPGYYRELPKLASGHLSGYPRVLGVAWALVAHTDSHLDPETLRRFVRAYQEVQPLTIGELWAVPITLRFVLIENLRRLAARVMASRAARNEADAVADRLFKDGDAGFVDTIAERFDQATPPDAFFVELILRLRDQDPKIAPALAWIDDQLARRGLSADDVVRQEHQRQVAGSVTIRNIITSMRLIADVDWSEVFEQISLVDDTLRAAADFARMDFPTRNLYRNAIEDLARGSGRSETEIARAVVDAAQTAAAREPQDLRRADPGYHLIAAGRTEFERVIGYRASIGRRVGRTFKAAGVVGYIGASSLVSALFLAVPLVCLAFAGVEAWRLWLLGVLGLIPAIDAAVALVNAGLTRAFRATRLPGLELRDGVPADLRTVVATPTLLTSIEGVEEQIERLETHYLASVGGEVHYALLSDWSDAPHERMDNDDALLAAAREGIARLNRLYGPAPGGDRFLLLHRRRLWNEGEGRWIGWERKRGKLQELNRLLRGTGDTSFLAPAVVPDGVRFVVTLDADTRLPRDTLARLIGKMAHALNRPRLDLALHRVVEGYGVLQPRVTPALPVGREGSLFLRIFSQASGIDPYAAAISDVYQDLFGEGTYTGKGIYDIDAFEAALAGRVPESAVLSHDLFEGVYARAGLVTDVEVVEGFPSRYDTAALRHHRWARGDWQLLPWILGRRPAWADGGPGRAMPALGRCKMLDNLRRTLSVLALIAGWTLSPGEALLWTTFILATITLPALVPLLASLAPSRSTTALWAHLSTLLDETRLVLVQAWLMTTFLAHQAWLMGDAIVRTLIRLFVTRRRLLEWTPAAQANFGSQSTVLGYYRHMGGAAVVGLGAVLIAWRFGEGAWPMAAAFGALWIASPAIAMWASRSPRAPDRRPLAMEEAAKLRRIARRTWRFFETFVTPADNMLPPDNFQETPKPVLARRTSPTNLGLYLLSIGSARDLGWIGLAETVEKLEASLSTMGRLARHKGHFYNWYDTSDLRPLDPPYVSSVDSGNLSGHLIALANACRDWSRAPAFDAAWRGGVADAVALAREDFDRLHGVASRASEATRRLDEALTFLERALTPAQASEHPSALLAAVATKARAALEAAHACSVGQEDAAADLLFWTQAVCNTLASHARDLDDATATSLRGRLEAIAVTASTLALDMDFSFLLDPDRMLLSIGYRVAEGARDPSCYDLLASEARLASFMAIAKGDAPARHWFRLGHAVTPVGVGAALISWSGSMFEYLMPSLVMRAPSSSLLEQTNRLIVRRQIEYATVQGKPWGVSESAFNARDLELTYQYSNFGVPSLGLKRGLGDSLVIAPYATALAAMVDPPAAIENFARLVGLGAAGRYGFYEALDFTPERLPEGQTMAVVQAFMAHHQGMTIVALADALLDGVMRSRFHAEPIVQATELLLQERIPREVAVVPPSVVSGRARIRPIEAGSWRSVSPHAAAPETVLLSNGRYRVMVTAVGSGSSVWRDLAITRWREDPVRDDWGSYIYLRDVEQDLVWSAGLQPTGVEPDELEVIFNEERAEFTRRDGALTTSLQVLVSAEEDAEVRRVILSNAGVRPREVEITSYAELVLAPQAADTAHPAFSKLFVETEYAKDVGALLATRRRRASDEREIWAAHLAVVDGDVVGEVEFETDRARFIGRGRDTTAPLATTGRQPLSGTVGPVLDPIFALRRRVRIEPGATARIDFWTMAADSREAVLDLVDKHRDREAFERAAALAWTQAQVQLHHLGLSRSEAGDYQRLASHILYAGAAMRAGAKAIAAGSGPQSGLWSLGISGDLPIMLVRVADVHALEVVRQALEAVEYWRIKGLAADLVILNEQGASYVQELQQALEALVRANQSRPRIGEDRPPGHIFMLRGDLIAPDTRALLSSVARVELVGERGQLSEQLPRPSESRIAPRPRAQKGPLFASENPEPPAGSDAEFFNGIGGFVEGGREYMTVLRPGVRTPAPWINVIANPKFGFQVSSEGAGYSWSQSSRERQLTPWSNDPVVDRPGQVVYLRDEDDGALWTATASPIRDERATYVARHGWGYSRFEHQSQGIGLELLEYDPLADPVRISRLTLQNRSDRRRRLSVTAYAEWALGPSREGSAPYTVCSLDETTGTVFATSRWDAAFAGRTAFLDLGGRQSSAAADRREFIGRNGTLAAPLALAGGEPLSGRAEAGASPCGAVQTLIVLEPGESVEIPIFLGDGVDADDARRLINAYRAADLDAVLSAVREHWDSVLGAVHVRTPDRALDLMLNGWLLYQATACRLWGRSGFYQASGAYGFRDQLQDVMALTAARPQWVREHLLRAAGRQFVEGDVQHWWLPHTGQGVRTRITDDRLWLPFVAAHYVAATGDTDVLDQSAPFLLADPLEDGEAERFLQPEQSRAPADVGPATLYEHCARAIDVSLSVGAHGAPLIGGGDWNDGFNRVGVQGRGESVWLGWFLCAVIEAFAPLAHARKDDARVKTWTKTVADIAASLEREAWDADWYLRGWFDDGSPLGSAVNRECRIDSIAQSWAVLSGTARPERAAHAMAALERELVLPQEKLALLFTPPFDASPSDPGYIKGYPPGVRENGGQYSHAALWSAMAFAAMGEGDKAWSMLSMLNPVNHALTRADTERYGVEPYVAAADVYALPGRVGRGGWTWYTGSAAWMQRAGVEALLGLRLRDGRLEIDPCIPRAWPAFEATLKRGGARYEIHVHNPRAVCRGVTRVRIDGEDHAARPVRLPFGDDGADHRIEVTLG
jgi:cyclic beta-1,2-glucan synthetase